MADLKKSWTQTAKSFILAFNDLGVSVVDSVKVGRDIVIDWAKKDNPHVQDAETVDAEGVEVPEAEPVAEAEEVPEVQEVPEVEEVPEAPEVPEI